MALSNSWFQNWQSPVNYLPETATDHMDIFKVKHEPSKSRGGTSNFYDFLPYFVSLGIITPENDNPTTLKPRSFEKPDTFKKSRKPSPKEKPGSLHNHHVFEPAALEQTGPFKTHYYWKQLDYDFPSKYERRRAIDLQEFIPENNLPLGLELYGDRLFVTMPKWKAGIPVTLAVLPKVPKESSPKLVPYPGWEWHNCESCDCLTSVFRVQADSCGRLWVLDSGQIDVSTNPTQICPPQIFIFDLQSDSLLLRYELPEEFIKQDSLYSNIIVDIRDGDCQDVHAYVADVWRFGLVVFSLQKQKSWRVTDHLFYPDPLAAAFDIHGVKFEWTDGLFSLALGPVDPKTKDRLLYFHPMSSFRECFVKTSVICNETGWANSKDAFQVIGESRGANGHASAAGMDRNGILYYNLVSKDAIGCWDSSKPYKRINQGVIVKNSTTLVFPNDLKIDNEERQSVWILTNRLPFYLYRGLKKNEINFRIMSAYTDEAVEGTICHPENRYLHTYEPPVVATDCY